jgi:thiol-disulfide isomerase/thioredoxin
MIRDGGAKREFLIQNRVRNNGDSGFLHSRIINGGGIVALVAIDRPRSGGTSVARAILVLFLFLLGSFPVAAQQSSDPITQALAQGDLYFSKRKYDLALDAYHKADKLSHHSSAACYLKLASVERKTGDFSSALDDAKHALKVAGDDKSAALQAHLVRATLLTQLAGKPTDKKLKEAEDELRQALSLDAARAVTHLDLGIVLLKQERDPEGLAELNTFVSSPGVDSASLAEARRMIANPVRARSPFAPDFSFTTHEKQSVSNAALRGKVVLLDFWGTWCPPCRESVPTLRNLNKKFLGKSFQLIGISSDDDEEVWSTFIQAQHMDWSEYIDSSEKVLTAFKIESFPTYIVLDKDGVIRFRQSGFGPATELDLEEAINKALKRESDPKLAAAVAAESQPQPATATKSSAAASPVVPPVAASKTSPAVSVPGNNIKLDDGPAVAPVGIEAGNISGNVYKNEGLGLTFQFPQGWTAASAELLHTINERTEAAAKAAILKQHPELMDSSRISVPKFIFYGSRKGDWDGQHMAIPSIRISAIPSRLDSVTLDAFQHTIVNRIVASGMAIIGTPSEFQVNKHPFVRGDFERSVGALHVYQSYVQTIAGDYLLTIELFASSQEELQQIAASLQSMSITDDEP